MPDLLSLLCGDPDFVPRNRQTADPDPAAKWSSPGTFCVHPADFHAFMRKSAKWRPLYLIQTVSSPP
ncbi:MAG: hypothetical protein J6A23_11705 [Thermoguttaceae bacterium]|nr:hypothetical protein [Thermoguttaceae bacterium]